MEISIKNADALTLDKLAYQLADQLRSDYTDKNQIVPDTARQNAISQLRTSFPNVSYQDIEKALAQGFFASR